MLVSQQDSLLALVMIIPYGTMVFGLGMTVLVNVAENPAQMPQLKMVQFDGISQYFHYKECTEFAATYMFSHPYT